MNLDREYALAIAHVLHQIDAQAHEALLQLRLEVAAAQSAIDGRSYARSLAQRRRFAARKDPK